MEIKMNMKSLATQIASNTVIVKKPQVVCWFSSPYSPPLFIQILKFRFDRARTQILIEFAQLFLSW